MKFVKALVLILLSSAALADAELVGPYTRYFGSGANNNDVLFTAEVSQYDACTIMSTTGAVDVFVSLDGANFATAALSMQDMGATSTDPVLVTAVGRVYGFVVKARSIRVMQNGATAAAASMNCWKL